jgi:hypothetical protein
MCPNETKGKLRKIAVFLAHLRKNANVGQACQAAGLPRASVGRWRKAFPALKRAWLDAVADAYDSLEREAWRRAKDGCSVPIYQGGKRVGYKREFSDTLTVKLLEAGRPRKYRKRVEMSHTGQISHRHTIDAQVQARLADPRVIDLVCQLDSLVSIPEKDPDTPRALSHSPAETIADSPAQTDDDLTTWAASPLPAKPQAEPKVVTLNTR